MNLAIFGDSFADDISFKNEFQNKDKSWIDFLNEEKNYSISNFSQSGSSLWWSFKQFCQNHNQYEKIIFLITFPHRITLPQSTGLKIRPHHQPYNTELHLQFASDDKIEQYKLINEYYKNIHDDERELYLHDSLVTNIKDLRPDAILYPCSKRSIKDSKDLALLEITKHEETAWGGFDLEHRKLGLYDTRMCHLTENNNRILANLFLDKLKGYERVLTLQDIHLPENPRSHYLKKVEWGT